MHGRIRLASRRGAWVCRHLHTHSVIAASRRIGRGHTVPGRRNMKNPVFATVVRRRVPTPPASVLGRAVGTRFPFASTAERFRLATDNNSQTHYAKGKQSPRPFYVHCVHLG